MNESKKIPWSTLAFMAFSTVWGFGNVVNGFGYFNGVQAIFSWILVFALYFVPYALMVGELGSAFKNEGGGVSSWLRHTMSPRIAYYAGWTYWVVHMPYIAQKPNGALNALSWVIFRNGTFFKELNPIVLQLACLTVFFIFMWIASMGINPLKRLASLAGTSMFIMSILFIILMFVAPVISTREFVSIDWSWDNLIPTFDWKYFTSLSILIYAVGGCEKISPYVNKVKDPERGFPKGMIALAIMVTICAVLGTIALGRMYDPATTDLNEFITMGAYTSFQILGEHFHIGNTFLIIYALCNVVGQLSTLVISIDAPTRMLLDSEDSDYIPKGLLKKNKNGVYTRGYALMAVIVTLITIIPALGIGQVTSLFQTFTKLNSVTMPLRYLWVFLAYIMLKVRGTFDSEYKFTKNRFLGIGIGVWCFGVTAFCCLLGMYSENTFEMALNILTPIFLVGLGLIMPLIAKHQNKKAIAE